MNPSTPSNRSDLDTTDRTTRAEVRQRGRAAVRADRAGIAPVLLGPAIVPAWGEPEGMEASAADAYLDYVWDRRRRHLEGVGWYRDVGQGPEAPPVAPSLDALVDAFPVALQGMMQRMERRALNRWFVREYHRTHSDRSAVNPSTALLLAVYEPRAWWALPPAVRALALDARTTGQGAPG